MPRTARSKKRIPVLPLVFAALSAGAIGALLWQQGVLSTLDNRSQASTMTDAFVHRQGTEFRLEQQKFAFVGFNLFDAAGAGNSPYSCLETNGWWTKFSDAELDQAMKTMKRETGATVLRFWAFQKYTNGGTDFSGIDKVIRLAKLNGLKVMPVLEDGPGYCTEPGGGGNGRQEKWKYKDDTWYTEGYKVANAPYTLSYREYVSKIVERYKDDPTVFGWTLMNEADTSRKVLVDGKQQSALVGFTKDMGALVKSIDSKHLLTVGTQSNGASGATGQDFIDVYSIPEIDFATAHDWGYWGNDTQAIPGGTTVNGKMGLPDPLSAECLKTYQAKIGCSLAQATLVVKKPIVFTEVGISANDDSSRKKRSELMDAKMAAFFENGGSGYLYWQWNKVVDTQKYDVLANTNDPLLPVMKKYAGLAIPPLAETIKPTATPRATVVATPTPRVTPIPVVATAVPTAVSTPVSIPTPSIVVIPTATPVATVLPQTGTIVRPAAPVVTPTPRLSPSPAPDPGGSAQTHVEGESLSFAANKARVAVDDSASSQSVLVVTNNSTVTGTLTGPLEKLVVRANGQFCHGNPHINVKINGKYVMDTNITSSGYKDYVSNSIKNLSLGSGPYNVEIIYNNDAYYPWCDRNILIDSIRAL